MGAIHRPAELKPTWLWAEALPYFGVQAGNAGPLGHSSSGWVWRSGAGPGAGLCRMCQALGRHCVGSSWGPSHFSLLLPRWLPQILPPPQKQAASCSPQAPDEVRSALALSWRCLSHWSWDPQCLCTSLISDREGLGKRCPNPGFPTHLPAVSVNRGARGHTYIFAHTPRS